MWFRRGKPIAGTAVEGQRPCEEGKPPLSSASDLSLEAQLNACPFMAPVRAKMAASGLDTWVALRALFDDQHPENDSRLLGALAQCDIGAAGDRFKFIKGLRKLFPNQAGKSATSNG